MITYLYKTSLFCNLVYIQLATSQYYATSLPNAYTNLCSSVQTVIPSKTPALYVKVPPKPVMLPKICRGHKSPICHPNTAKAYFLPIPLENPKARVLTPKTIVKACPSTPTIQTTAVSLPLIPLIADTIPSVLPQITSIVTKKVGELGAVPIPQTSDIVPALPEEEIPPVLADEIGELIAIPSLPISDTVSTVLPVQEIPVIKDTVGELEAVPSAPIPDIVPSVLPVEEIPVTKEVEGLTNVSITNEVTGLVEDNKSLAPIIPSSAGELLDATEII